MADKNTFTTEEWATLRQVPHIVGMAIAGSGGGVVGAVKEALSAARTMAENAQNASGVIRDICNPEEAKAAEENLRKLVMDNVTTMTPDKLKQMAVDSASKATTILKEKAGSEVEAYGDFVLNVADSVSKAAKEGGFLGFGGELVSAGETAVISSVSAALKGTSGISSMLGKIGS